jgi:predicted nucleic acid-binding protein
LSPKRWKQPPKGVVDTSVLVAGVSGFRGEPTDNPSAALLAAWTEAPTFAWLLTEDILSEYLEVLERLHVRSAQKIVSLIREQGQFVRVTTTVSDIPDRDDAAFCECAESANADFLVTLNPGDFPQNKLNTKVIAPSDPLPPRGRKPRPRRRPLAIRKK